jgi:NTE family protein
VTLKKSLVLALSGGGAHAAAHAGVITELEAQGARPTGYAGVSGGALVAAAYLGGASMEALVEEASRLHPWFWVRGWGGGLLSGTKLGVLIDEFLPKERFEDLSAPLAVLATDVDTGKPVVLRTGNVRDAVRASCSFPGVFPPFLLDGRRLYDGGVSDVVPVKLAREMAGDEGVVVAVDVNGGTRWPAAESFVAIALRAGLTLLRSRTRVELSGADLVIAPAMGDSGWMQPRKIPTFYEAGREAARTALPEILRLVES